MKVPFFDYKGYCRDINYQVLLEEVLETGYLIGGPFVDNVEKKIQEITGIKNCVCVANATDAMEIIFGFLDLPKGSNVIVPAHTMLATASAAKTANLNPIPIDVDNYSHMIEIEEIKKCDLKNVSALMITQLNGIVADMSPIDEFCKKNNIALIEDSAQGIGAFNNDKHAGSWGIGGCISFYPAKVIGCLGDGGALITNNSELAEYARSVRDHGRGVNQNAVNWGRNSRLDSLNARIVLERLGEINVLIEKRRNLAKIYIDNLKYLEDNQLIKLPSQFSTNSKSLGTFQNFEVQFKNRDNLITFLENNGVSTIKQWGGYSIAHFSELGFDINKFPSTKKLFQKLLLLPMNHMMNDEEVNYVCDIISCFYREFND